MHAKLLSLVVATSAFIVADAEAKPRRVVVLEFDGPRRLADIARSTVMSVLGDQYNIVATRNWDAARARSPGRGHVQWRQASKKAGVDAVIEGWVQPEGKHHVLTVAVREAATGRELDTLSVRIKEAGVPTGASQKLAVQLDDLLKWIDGDINADPTPTLQDVRPLLGARDSDRERRRDDVDERNDRADRADDDERHRGTSRRQRDGERREHRRDDRERDDHERDDRERDDRRDRDDRDGDDGDDRSDRSDDRDDRDDRRTRKRRRTVADDRDTSDLVKLFGPESKEAEIVSDGSTKHTPKPTPRFQIGAGPYVSARGMTFQYDPEAQGNPPEYPGQTLKGFAASALVYPMPKQAQDGTLSGVGFSFELGHSVLSMFTAMDETGYGDYTLNHSFWNLGLHYRWPIDFVSIDIRGDFGNFSHRIVDLPESIQIPDTSYSYLGAGASIDLQVTEGTTIGFGARYLYLMSAGDISDEDWYGSGKAWGAALDGNFVIPIHGALYVQGAIEYKRVQVDFEGSGMLAQTWGVWDVVDSSITGSGLVGVKF